MEKELSPLAVSLVFLKTSPRSVHRGHLHLARALPRRRRLELQVARRAGHWHVVQGSHEAALGGDAQLRGVANVGPSLQSGFGLRRPHCRSLKRVLIINKRFERTKKRHTRLQELSYFRIYSHVRSRSHGYSRSNERRRVFFGVWVVRHTAQDELSGFEAPRLPHSTPRLGEDLRLGLELNGGQPFLQHVRCIQQHARA